MYVLVLFFFNDTATTEIYTLSLHDALPIWPLPRRIPPLGGAHLSRARGAVRELPRSVHHPRGLRAARDQRRAAVLVPGVHDAEDRKSTRLNSSHANISYAVFCLKKKKTIQW